MLLLFVVDGWWLLCDVCWLVFVVVSCYRCLLCDVC